MKEIVETSIQGDTRCPEREASTKSSPPAPAFAGEYNHAISLIMQALVSNMEDLTVLAKAMDDMFRIQTVILKRLKAEQRSKRPARSGRVA